MPITPACCCLCGEAVLGFGAEPLWMSEFVAVYALGHEINTKAYLSGPGRREQFADVVSATSKLGLPEEQRDDGSFEIELMHNAFDRSYVLPGTPCAWGFPFHASCWKLANHALSIDSDVAEPAADSIESFEMDSLLQSLFNLCRIFPAQDQILNWGHGYQPNFISSQDRTRVLPPPGVEAEVEIVPRTPSSAYQTSDPFDIPRLRAVFDVVPKEKRENVNGSSPRHQTCYQHRRLRQPDSFESLPVEIRSWILNSLSNEDVVSLRVASPAFCKVILTDSFWKSRFLPSHEMHCVPEARQLLSSPKHLGQWKAIYTSVKRLQLLPAMENRKRVWSLSLAIRDAMDIIRDSPCHGTPIRSFFEPEAPLVDDPHRRWITAKRCLKTEKQPLFFGCRATHQRMLTLPPAGVVAINLSTANLFGQRYISGIRLVDTEGGSHILGYIHPKSEFVLHSSGDGGPCVFRGFCLAQDQRGIRGMAAVIGPNATSRWLGDHVNIPKRRLVLESENVSQGLAIDHLKGGFDAAKLVSLAVSSNSEEPQTQDSEPLQPLGFRDTAIWYPSIPDSSLRFLGTAGKLNGPGQFNEPVTLLSRFGETDDADLVRVTVQARSHGPGNFSDFLSITSRYRTLQGEKTSQLGVRDADQDLHLYDLDIDGPGGERIIEIRSLYGYGHVAGFKILTNRGQEADFPPGYEVDMAMRDGHTRNVKVEEGRVAGLWAIYASG